MVGMTTRPEVPALSGGPARTWRYGPHLPTWRRTYARVADHLRNWAER